MNLDELRNRINAHAARGWSLRLRSTAVRRLFVETERDHLAFLGAAVVRRMYDASKRGAGVRLSVAEVKAAAGDQP